jgi:acyl-CoA thioester hydrolase
MDKLRNDFPTPDTWYRLHVSYGETDCAGVAYYGEYNHWFERSRSQLIREHGMSYVEVEDKGIILPVRQAYCRYLHPARYEDELFVRCAIEKWGRASVTFAYQIWGPPEQQTLIATGYTEHAAVSDGKPVRIPDWLKALFVN